jgi:formylmethanofuran dehydrogenase subunit E
MTQEIPKVLLVMKPVDGGRAMIGIIECPYCGETHYTTQIECGQRSIFCGVDAQRPDGYSTVIVERIV